MIEVEMTMMRALKVWWSFIWRMWVLMIPLWFFCVIASVGLFFAMGGLSKFNLTNPDPREFIKMGYGFFFFIYVVFVPAFLAMQIFAFKLALKATWSDFRLAPVSIVIRDTPSSVAADSVPPNQMV